MIATEIALSPALFQVGANLPRPTAFRSSQPTEIMPVSNYTQSSGVSKAEADDAKEELEKWVATDRPDLSDRPSPRPFEVIPIRSKTTSISEQFQVCNEHVCKWSLL